MAAGTAKLPVRGAGIMLPLASLPGPHGIGDMGDDAYAFVDLLAKHRVRYWQILPINPLGFGNSPYQPYSSFAGDPLFISLEALHAQGMPAEKPTPFAPQATHIDYEAVRLHKDAALRAAYAAFVAPPGYHAFISQPWVHDYAVFSAFKRVNGQRCWLEWPDAQKNWPLRRTLDLAPYAEDIGYAMFAQYVFFTQWEALKRYANERGIAIIGDIPIYVGIDSLDVWTDRDSFVLDAHGQPTHVAGVPPDYFSATGQRWGNPLYDWPHLQETGFAFWINRLRYSRQLFDVIRIDHFRGFDTYWEIPATCPTAVDGVWREAPGYALFDAIFAAMPDVQIIAEDLGMLREEVYTLRDHYYLRGMKILQFVFDPKAAKSPRRDKTHMVVYTGTHDNATTAGWFAQQPSRWRLRARWYLLRHGYRGPGIAQRFVSLALDDAADMAILPAQDILGLSDEARINTPGTVGSPNWEWKLADLRAMQAAMRWFGKMIHKYERG